MSALFTVGYFLLSILFGITTFVLWLRFGMQYFRISILHPMTQSIHRLTDPVLRPIANLLQVRQTRHQRYDWVCFGVLIIVEWIKFLLIGALYFGHSSLWTLTAIYTVADLIVQPCNLLFYALVIRVLMSWVNPNWHHPLAVILKSITEPMLHKIHRYVPYIAGFDFSPFIAMIALKTITLFVSTSLPFHIL